MREALAKLAPQQREVLEIAAGGLGVSEHRPEHLDLCAAWALGSLDEADRVRLEAHVASGCPECAAVMADFASSTVLPAASAPDARRGAPRRERDAGPLPARGRPPVPRGDRVIEMQPAWQRWAPLAAAAALVLVTGILWFQTARLGSELAASRARLAELEQRMAADREWSQVLTSPFARVSMLEPTTAGDPRLRARATYDPSTQRAVVVFENLAVPAGRDYELWVIRDGGPVSMGVVQPDAEGRATLRLENVGVSPTLSAFALSLEPRGGSPDPRSPSGPVVMVGPLSS